MDCSPPGSSVHEILQARILEWVAMPSSRGSSRPRDRTWAFCGSCTAGEFFSTESLGKPDLCLVFPYDSIQPSSLLHIFFYGLIHLKFISTHAYQISADFKYQSIAVLFLIPRGSDLVLVSQIIRYLSLVMFLQEMKNGQRQSWESAFHWKSIQS